jgi:lipopolysaccharide/colanic/teichoic acid biosynthesis glycosyltransferase
MAASDPVALRTHAQPRIGTHRSAGHIYAEANAWIAAFETASDVTACSLAAFVAIALYSPSMPIAGVSLSNRVVIGMSLSAGLIGTLLARGIRARGIGPSLHRVQETEHALRLAAGLSLIASPLVWSLHIPLFSLKLLDTFLSVILLLICEHQILFSFRRICISNLLPQSRRHTELSWETGPPVLLEEDPPRLWAYATSKRAFDIVSSSLLLCLFGPLLLAIAVVVQLDSAGPALFVQKRVGRGGRLFDIYKFRSMRVGVPRYAVSPASPHDSRITRIGRLLRKSSLDELPQLVNVLKGHMSLVGPRPEMPFIVDQYDTTQMLRLSVVPGITGLWQLSADRGSQIHENLYYDLDYIRNRSFLLDTAILLHTLFFAMRGV